MTVVLIEVTVTVKAAGISIVMSFVTVAVVTVGVTVMQSNRRCRAFVCIEQGLLVI